MKYFGVCKRKNSMDWNSNEHSNVYFRYFLFTSLKQTCYEKPNSPKSQNWPVQYRPVASMYLKSDIYCNENMNRVCSETSWEWNVTSYECDLLQGTDSSSLWRVHIIQCSEGSKCDLFRIFCGLTPELVIRSQLTSIKRLLYSTKRVKWVWQRQRWSLADIRCWRFRLWIIRTNLHRKL